MCVLLHMCVLWGQYLAVACAQRSAMLWQEMKCWKPPGVAGCTGWSGSPVFTCSATVVNVNWERLEKVERVHAFFLPLCSGRVDTQQTAPLFSYRCSSSSALLQMLGKLGSNHGFLGMDRKPHSFPLSLSLSVASFSSGMIVLWCTVHISNYPES